MEIITLNNMDLSSDTNMDPSTEIGTVKKMKNKYKNQNVCNMELSTEAGMDRNAQSIMTKKSPHGQPKNQYEK